MSSGLGVNCGLAPGFSLGDGWLRVGRGRLPPIWRGSVDSGSSARFDESSDESLPMLELPL